MREGRHDFSVSRKKIVKVVLNTQNQKYSDKSKKYTDILLAYLLIIKNYKQMNEFTGC